MNIAFRRYLLALRRWSALILIGPLLAGGAGYWASSQQPPIYSSSVRIIVGQTLQNVNPDYGSLAASERLVSTYAELAHSRSIAGAVAAQLGQPDIWNGVELATKPVPDTEFLDIQVLAPNPQQATDIANAIASQLIEKSPSGPQSPEAQIRSAVESQITSLNSQISAADEEITQLKAQIAQLDLESQEAQPLLQQLQLTQQVQSDNRQTLSTLYSTALGNRANTLSVVEPAIVQPLPIAPRPISAGILAGLAGLILAVAFVLGLEYLDETIKSPDEAVDAIGAPLLAAVLKQHKSSSKDRGLTSRADPRSLVAESFRTLRTNLQFSNIDAKTRTLIVTSAQPGEGKSTITSNLAWTLAQAGMRVILVDADLRKPTQHRIFDISNEYGLTNLLTQEDAPGIAAQTVVQVATNLSVVPSGPQPPNPSELLSSKRMEMLIWLFQQEYDWVLFDTPPVLTVTDALALAPRTDGVLFVAEGKRSRRDTLSKSRLALETVGARILGIVVNKVDQRAEGYYSYYSYYYDHHLELGKRRWWAPWSRKPLVVDQPRAADKHKGAALATKKSGPAENYEAMLVDQDVIDKLLDAAEALLGAQTQLAARQNGNGHAADDFLAALPKPPRKAKSTGAASNGNGYYAPAAELPKGARRPKTNGNGQHRSLHDPSAAHDDAND